MFSIHHVRDFLNMARMEKKADLRIIGGHPMQSNPRPIIPFADIICVGEGESWLKKYMKLSISQLKNLKTTDGVINCKDWTFGDPLPSPIFEAVFPDNPPYLNHADSRSKAWYIEIARGCPWKCSYCELGHSSPFRSISVQQFDNVVEQIDISKTRKVNLFAPDEGSGKDINLFRNKISEKTGTLSPFSSIRIESFNKRQIDFPKNALIRIGLDGLTEKTRFRVCKKITNDALYEYFKSLILRGHCQFKIFMIFSYSWDTESDFDEWENVMNRIMSIPLKKNVSLRIKWTAFIPQPKTPLSKEKPCFNHKIVNRINMWHAIHHKPQINPGWYVECDGVSGMSTHKKECSLTSGNERELFRWDKSLKPLHKI